MLSLGKQITQVADPLSEVSVGLIFKALTNPGGPVSILVNRLQFIRTVDVNQYRKMKTQLPYIVCGQFFPPFRNKDNFVNTIRFIVDIDHFYDHGLDIHQIKQELQKDKNVELLYTSPGGDGLKVLFKLKDKISDSGYYSAFYKIFCEQFGQKYQLGSSIDMKTHDISRCCFVSFDPDAYYNPIVEPIEAAFFLDPNGFTNPKKAGMSKPLETELSNTPYLKSISNFKADLPSEVLNLIKQKIGQKIKEPKVKFFEQNAELDPIIEEIKNQLIEVGATIEKISPISFGRQIKVIAGKYWAEVNVFYGKKGLSIVGTIKTGSNKELCDSIVMMLKNHFF